MMPADETRPLPIIILGHPTICAVLADVLDDEGYAVVTADDRPTAHALARGGPLRLIVVDLDVSHSDGAAFCHAYREHGGTAPIVLLTTAHVGAEQARSYGADGYLVKPFDLDVVIATVARLVGPA